MAELTQTQEVVHAVALGIQDARRLGRDGVQPTEITDRMAPGPLKDAVNAAIAGAEQVEAELAPIQEGNLGAIAELAQIVFSEMITVALAPVT